MAETHLQINADGSTVMRKTVLWPSTVSGREEVLKSIFSRDNWEISRLYNVAGPHWKIEVSCQHVSYKINLYISSVRDEARQEDEFKMQLGGTYPTGNEDGWITLILGIYAIADDDENIVDYILSAYSSRNLDFSGNPSIRGTRTNGLQMARILGFYKTEKSYLFRPEFLYYYIQNQELLDIRSTAMSRTKDIEQPKQIIFYGAPGTSKSHTIKETTEKIEEETKQNGEEARVFRTTFHPDSDYSTFVGCYKPCMRPIPQTYIVEGEEKPVKGSDGQQVTKKEIVYSFIPQSFTNAYIRAWQTDKPVYLVIEEINRGNCAQIFGDLFQLLDRKNNISEYPIQPDADLGNYLKEQLENKHSADTPEEIFKGEKLCLPSNLYIWASMNTSDQSLFPIDSAFKRRWDWKYMKITNMDEKVDHPYKIIVKENEYQWWAFVDKMNNHIGSSTSSEDKKLGYFFIHREDGIISADDFVSKVLFYLYNDALKDYSVPLKVKKDSELKTASFSDFYDEEGKVLEDKVIETLDDFLKVDKKETAEDQQ